MEVDDVERINLMTPESLPSPCYLAFVMCLLYLLNECIYIRVSGVPLILVYHEYFHCCRDLMMDSIMVL